MTCFRVIAKMCFTLILINLVLGCSKNNDENTAPIGDCNSYFIDSINGDDNNDGCSPEKAWKSFVNLNQKTLGAGNSVNLKKGSVWNETFKFRGSGDESNPIIITSYGSIRFHLS